MFVGYFMFDVLLEVCIIMNSRIYKTHTRSIILTDFFLLESYIS